MSNFMVAGVGIVIILIATYITIQDKRIEWQTIAVIGLGIILTWFGWTMKPGLLGI